VVKLLLPALAERSLALVYFDVVLRFEVRRQSQQKSI